MSRVNVNIAVGRLWGLVFETKAYIDRKVFFHSNRRHLESVIYQMKLNKIRQKSCLLAVIIARQQSE